MKERFDRGLVVAIAAATVLSMAAYGLHDLLGPMTWLLIIVAWVAVVACVVVYIVALFRNPQHFYRQRYPQPWE
jgi:hypothetical protein